MSVNGYVYHHKRDRDHFRCKNCSAILLYDIEKKTVEKVQGTHGCVPSFYESEADVFRYMTKKLVKDQPGLTCRQAYDSEMERSMLHWDGQG